MDDFNKKKYSELIKILSSYKRIAIAFSGGIDSTLLMHAAIDALGTDNVTAVSFVSSLQRVGFKKSVTDFFLNQFGQKANLIVTKIDPLGVREFQRNDQDRCYHCKKQMYANLIKIVQKFIGTESIVNLCDGTNYSDLSKDRPGYKAIKEYNIVTPLADVFLEKREIRIIARCKNISNWDLASDSCLATRIERNTIITLPLLKIIEESEDYLYKHGFKGCRVRYKGDVAEVQVLDSDYEKIAKMIETDLDVIGYFKKLGYKKVILDSIPRKQ